MELAEYKSGNGYGYGYGYGYGDLPTYITALLESADVPNNAIPAIWRSNKYGTPANGGTGGARCVGQTEEIKSGLEICTRNALHGTHDPSKWKGERWFIVALHLPVQCQDDKIASAKRTIIKDLGMCPFS